MRKNGFIRETKLNVITADGGYKIPNKGPLITIHNHSYLIHHRKHVEKVHVYMSPPPRLMLVRYYE